MQDSNDFPPRERRHEERRHVAEPVDDERRVLGDRRNDIHEWGSQLNRETAALADRVARLTDALTEIGRVQDRQMKLEQDIRLANEETRDLNELVTHEHQRRQRRTYAFIVLVSVAASLITLAIGAAIYNAVKPAGPFDPFNFPVQTVQDRFGGATDPTVHVGADVHVTATKCSSAKHAVPEQGSTVWSLVDPAGTTITVSTGSAGKVAPGCSIHEYDNQMPAAVVTRSKELFAQGQTSVKWTINGVERPLQTGGVAEAWQTEPFAVVP